MAAKKLLIPVRRLRPQSGAFRFGPRPVLASPTGSDMLPLEQLARDLARVGRTGARAERNTFGPAAVRIRRDKTIPGQEAYRIVVAADGIEILAAGDAGAYYGVQTLRDLLAIHGAKLPACVIDDRPDFARRGVYHDCARGKVPKLETLKALVERLAHWKINELQLYVENAFAFKQHPAISRGYSPLTPEEFLELQDHCKRHHVRFVGSLACFGHMERTLCLPQYAHLREKDADRFRGGSTLCPGDPGSIRLVSELFEEFLPLFESEDFNVCCDETWELGAGRSKARADRIGVGRVYLEFLLKIYDLCGKHGKRMNAWADIVLKYPKLLRHLPKDVVMLNWDYNMYGVRVPRTKEIAAAKLPLVVCPGTGGWNSHGTRMTNSMGNVSRFAAQGRKCGAEGLLNTDWGDNGHRNTLGVSLHSFAHGAAQAWHGRAVDDKTFTETFCFHAFGQKSSKLATALRKLGNSYLTAAGGNEPNVRQLNLAAVSRLLPSKPQRWEYIENASPAGVKKVISQLSDPGIWPAPAPGMAPFERLALKEFALAASMDCLGARKILTATALREGKAVPAKELRALANQTRRAAAGLQKLWLTRNKPSLLRENLRLLRTAEAEALRLAKR